MDRLLIEELYAIFDFFLCTHDLYQILFKTEQKKETSVSCKTLLLIKMGISIDL